MRAGRARPRRDRQRRPAGDVQLVRTTAARRGRPADAAADIHAKSIVLQDIDPDDHTPHVNTPHDPTVLKEAPAAPAG